MISDTFKKYVEIKILISDRNYQESYYIDLHTL